MKSFLEIVFKHARAIKIIFLSCLAVTALGNFLVTPIYESRAKLLVGMGREMTLPTTVMNQPLNFYFNQSEMANNQVEVLSGRVLVGQALAQIGKREQTDRGGSLFGIPLERLAAFKKELFARLSFSKADDPAQAAIDNAIRHLKVIRAENSQVLIVTYRDADPVYAQTFLTTLLNLYEHFTPAALDSPKSLAFFSTQQGLMADELEAAREELATYRRKWNITDLVAQKQNLVEATTRVSNELLDVQLRMGAITGQINTLKTAPIDEVDGYISEDLRKDPAIVETLRNIVNIKTRISKLQPMLGAAHPDVVTLVAQRSNLLKSVKTQSMAILTSNLSLLQTREQSLADKHDALRDQSLLLDEKGGQMASLQRKIKVLETKYFTYADKRETSRVNSALDKARITSVSVVEQPTRPVTPVFPRKLLNLVLAAVLGLAAGCCYAFGLEQLMGRINSVEELHALSGCKVFITVPDFDR